MRIVLDIEADDQVCCGGTGYLNLAGWQGDNGNRVTVTLVVGDKPRDVLELEGRLEDVAKLFRSALAQLDLIKDASAERLGKMRRTNCPNCEALGDNAHHTKDCRMPPYGPTGKEKKSRAKKLSRLR
jgi:hypothetical protein